MPEKPAGGMPLASLPSHGGDCSGQGLAQPAGDISRGIRFDNLAAIG